MRFVGLLGLLGLPGVLAAGCEAEDPARAVAARFVDHYYVELDLAAALPDATGLAHAKLLREQELLAGIDAPADAGRPSVYYRFLEEGEAGATRRSFLYELTITFSDAHVVREALVTVREDEAGRWRVANFRELS